MDIRQTVYITLAGEPPKIIDGYWHEWVNGEWINTGVKAEGNDGTNHLIMGFFSDKIQYKLSPAGIPVVKQPDGTQGNFSAYELTAPQSTFNHATGKGTFVLSEWKLVENVDFIYMQEAYIERLQASLVTAEKIESLNIKTSKLEVTDGAKIGGMTISGDMLVSQNGRVVVDGVNNAIYLLDENGSIKTALRPDDLPSLASYFSSSFNKTVDTAPITGSYTESYNQKQSVSFNLPIGSFEAIIPEMTLHVYVTSTSELGGGMSLRVELVSPSGVYEIGSVSAWASGQFGSDDQSRTIPRRTLSISGAGACYLRIRLQNDSIGGSHATGSGSVLVSSNMVVNGVVNRSEIGNNGMMIATSRTRYDYMVGGTSEVRRGDYIFRVTENGIQKSSNGGSSWNIL